MHYLINRMDHWLAHAPGEIQSKTQATSRCCVSPAWCWTGVRPSGSTTASIPACRDGFGRYCLRQLKGPQREPCFEQDLRALAEMPNRPEKGLL
jgi:hypothetical protein